MKIALIDADFIPYYVCHNKKLEDGTKENKTLQECKQQVDSFIDAIMVNTGATHYIMALTVGRCFRYTVDNQYKANRKYDDPPEHLSAIKWYLRDSYNGVFFEGLEADDIVNICLRTPTFVTSESDKIKVTWVPMEIDGFSKFIVSPDKDLLMLEGRNYNPRKHEWVEVSKEEAKLYFWTSMITGDTIDGIKGIPKKGVKYAEKLFNDPDILVDNNYHQVVFNEYINYFGEFEGVNQFYKNYSCLKVVDKWEGFQIPEPVKYSIKI